MNIELCKDNSVSEAFYFRREKPLCYLSDNMTFKKAMEMKQYFQQLGFNVIDRTY